MQKVSVYSKNDENVKVVYNFDKIDPECHVTAYGMETSTETSHWGPGTRNVYILQFVLKGKGVFNKKEVSAGQGFFISSGKRIHYYENKDDPWHYFWISFSGNKIEQHLKDSGFSPDKNCIFDFDFSEWLEKFIDDIAFFDGKCAPDSRFGEAILLMLLSLISNKKNPLSDITLKHVEDAKEFIKNNFHTDISPSDVATELGIDKRYLSHIMKEKTGFSPKEYMTNLRISKSKQMLEGSDFSVTEVAYSVGYKDPLHFSKIFKEKTGLSPKNYRESFRNKKTTIDKISKK